MKTHLLLKRLLLLWIFAFSTTLWGQTTTFFNFTSSYVVPPAAGWTPAGSASGGSYLKLSPGSVTSPEYDSSNNVVFKYDIAAFGSGTSGSLTKLIFLNSSDDVISEFTLTSANSSTYIPSTLNVGSINTKFKVKIEGYGTGANGATNKGTRLQKYSLTGDIVSTGPTITATPSSLSGFTYSEGNGPSDAQTFSVTGSNLINDVTVSAPANYEVSTIEGSGYASSTSLTQAGGNVSSTVFARLVIGLSENNDYSGGITITSTGATAQTVGLSGEVTPAPLKPVITAPGAQAGTVGTAYTYQIIATEDPTVYALASGELPAGLTLDVNTGIISGTPTSVGSYTATITATNTSGTSDAVSFDYTIAKGTQTATLPNLILNVGDSSVTLPEQTSAGIAITYASSNNSVAAITGNILTVGSAGSATITATNPGDSNYEFYNTFFTVTVSTAPCFVEDFGEITVGNNTSTSGSSSQWDGNLSFPSIATAYQAGGAVRLGSGSNIGSITSKVLSTIGGDVRVTVDVKGWTSIEGSLKVSLGSQSQTVLYTATISDAFETKTFDFTNVPVGSQLKIETTTKRAFIDNVTISCGTVTVWNGTAWSNGNPDDYKDAIIDFDYSGTSFTSKDLTVNAGKTLTVPSTGFVKTGNVTNRGNIVVANNGNFLQIGTFTPEGTSTFELQRTSKEVKRYDYISWSSPMFSSPQTLQAFSPLTNDQRFYTYNNGTYVKIDTPGATTFTPGAGYQIRVPNNFADDSTGQKFNAVFTGTQPNTGAFTYDASGITSTTPGESYVFLGNPYPGALDMEAFYSTNSLITGVFYVWNSNNPMVTDEYTGSTYKTYTKVGVVPAQDEFGYVAAGQGFFVDRGANTINTFTFNDVMRTTTETGTFAKAGVTDKFWLQMTTPSGAKPQMLVGFDSNATAGIDAGYDAKMFDNNADVIYSTVDNQSLIINALGTFSSSNTVNVTANFLAAGNYTIGIAQKEGVFANGQQIYLKDNVTGKETELTVGDYTFEATAGINTDRFTITFTKGVLASSDVTKGQSVIYAADQIVHVNGSSKIASVQVYDMSGKLMKTATNVNSDKVSLPVTYKGIAIVKLTLENGEVVTKKIILK